MTGRRHRGWVALALAVTGLTVGCKRSSEPAAGPARPARIVSLSLATDEMLAELVPAERVVGVTFLVDDPEISNITGYYPAEIPRLRDRDLEQLIALAPDLVCVAPYNTADALALLERSGLALYRNDAVEGIDAIAAGVTRLGARVGEPGRARKLVASLDARRRRLADRLRDLPQRPRVLYWAAGVTAGRRTTIDDVIREAGGVNVAAELGLDGSVDIAPEQVVAADPEIVLLPRWRAEERHGSIANHPILRQLRAVRAGRVVAIEGRYLTSISPHYIVGAERLARALHPGRFAAEERP